MGDIAGDSERLNLSGFNLFYITSKQENRVQQREYLIN